MVTRKYLRQNFTSNIEVRFKYSNVALKYK